MNTIIPDVKIKLQNTTQQSPSPVIIYTNTTPLKRRVYVFIILGITILIILSILLYIFYTYRPHQPKPVDQRIPHYKTLIEQGAQSAGGIITASNSAKTSPGPTSDTKTVSATIYQINADSVAFLTDKNQLLTFPYKKMTLFTKAENLKKDQQVSLKITRSTETGEVIKIAVNKD